MSIAQEAPGEHENQRGVSRTKPIDAAKELVPIEALAERLGGKPLVQRGKKLIGICPLHDDHKPSLQIDAELGLFYCFPCQVGGDVVTLYRLASGYEEHEAHVAAAYLLLDFGHTPPPRPSGWSEKQARQKPIRDAIGRVKAEILRRRVFHATILPVIVATVAEGPKRDEEINLAWESFMGFSDAAILRWYALKAEELEREEGQDVA